MHFVLATANLISNSTVNYFSRAGKAGHTKVLSLEQPRIYRENPEQSLREHLKIWHISYKNEKLEPGEKKKKAYPDIKIEHNLCGEVTKITNNRQWMIKGRYQFYAVVDTRKYTIV